MTLDELVALYPRTRKTAGAAAVSGYIPIDVWLYFEGCVRAEMRKRMLRVYFRGPRVASRNRRTQASGTLKQDATHAVIYVRS